MLIKNETKVHVKSPSEGSSVGVRLGDEVGESDGLSLGKAVGSMEGIPIGDSVGMYDAQ